MKRRIGVIGLMCALVLTVGCSKDDESDFESIVGTWQGTSLEYEFIPDGSSIGFSDTDDDFDAVIEFKADGSVTYQNNGDESTGTYSIDGNKLNTTIDLSDDFPISSGTFTIKKLTKTSLRLYIEEEGEFPVPDFGTLEGEVQATINFERQ